MKQIADAIQYVHKLGIVHRDLKPSNVLLNATGRPKLTDFGIAKQVLLDEGLTTTAAPIGTPGYMAPEQTGRMETPISFATDVYGLGAVLYSILTGRPPFQGGNPVQVLDQVVAASPIPPRKLRPDVPVDLERICLKCLEKLPADRYAMGQELSEDLDRFTRGLPVRARPVPFPLRWWRLAKAQPIASSLFMLFTLFLVVLATSFCSFRIQSQTDRRNAEIQSLLLSIASCSPNRLEALLDQAERIDAGLLQQQIAELSNSQSLAMDRGTQLRWNCISKNAARSMEPRDLANAMLETDPQLLVVLSKRLINDHSYLNDEFKSALQESLVSSSSTEGFLSTACLLSRIDSSWEPDQEDRVRILRGLMSISSADIVHWSRALDPLSDSILDMLDRHGHEQKTPETTSLTSTGPLSSMSDEGENEIDSFWMSPTIQGVAWQWCRSDHSKVVRYIQRVPNSGLKEISRLSQETRTDTLRSLRTEFDLRLVSSNRLKPLDPSPMLSKYIERFDGIVTSKGGVFKSVPRNDLLELVATLAREGWGTSAIQGRDDAGVVVFSVAIERSADLCEIEFDVPVFEMTARMLERRKDGFEATHICTILSEVDRLTVLWRKGDWMESEFLTGIANSDQVRDRYGNNPKTHTPDLDTKALVQFYRDSVGDVIVDKAFILIASRKSQFSPPDNVRFIDFRCAIRESTTLVWLEEILVGGNGVVELVESIEKHDLKADWLLSQGAIPFYFDQDSKTGNSTSFWRFCSEGLGSESQKQSAKYAIGAWLLGDPSLSLEAMDQEHCPDLRTQVVEWIGRLDSSPRQFLTAFESANSSMRRYGLLTALANWRTEQFEIVGNEFQNLLQVLWKDNDPGVHFAADHVQRIAFPKQASPLINGELEKQYGLKNRGEDRKWYYGPFGLPFAIVDISGLRLVGGDERLNWKPSRPRSIVSLERTLAVCAVEVPEWLMAVYLGEIKAMGADVGKKLPASDGPARGYRLENMLRFCHWLNLKDGVTNPSLMFPSYPNFNPSPILEEKSWNADGYRLPTGVEWEAIAREKTMTGSFLGDSLEFLGSYAWTCENTLAQPGDTGKKKPSTTGLFDILGNVYESVLLSPDATWIPVGYGYRDGSNIWQMNDVKFVHLRGGSFLSHRIYCSSGAEHGIEVGLDINAGFRLIRVLE
jgi:serine/threonine protein kinase